MLSLSLLFSLSSSTDYQAMEVDDFKEQHHHANTVPNLVPIYKTQSSFEPLELANPSQIQEWNTNCHQFHVPFNIFSPDEERDNRLNIMHEKRMKRVISNRESARRSRMRKKKLIEELQFQVNQLQTLNHQLSEKVIRLLESNHQILQENAHLKEKVSSLQILFTDLLSPLRGLDEVTANLNRLPSSSTHSIHP
ncbi:hypothetical protein LWI28_011672 [Acer negundo]|uniref:BZIP domain-containing protein n=1 Tax=Acer negundo TaxID=4023 RepID=A0AAD5NPY2_ACENE|nr:hypothetical protein LWI28_003589 [Acer negundo]KAI9174081.1 hypothetical protein LWI28_011672 [Acer negundo]KAK4851540.1 hypothetical protein QYF36_016128 [Acer negundo]